MKRMLNKLIPFVLVLAILVLVGVSAQAEETGAYVLMNIPYAEFYAAEVTDASAMDAVTSATLMKPRTGGLAGGSYHVNADGSDITGVIFPVYVEDVSVLAVLGGTEITDESSVSITVTNRGQESTTAYEGKDALFEAPSYSWYMLTEAPSQYKKLTVADGKPVFSKASAEAETIAASARLLYDKHADQVIAMKGVSDTLGDQQVSGIILAANDGTRVGLRHIANIWRGPEIGFNFDSAVYKALSGKTIVSIEILTKEGCYAFDTEIVIAEDRRLASLSDTYIELFPEFAKEEYRNYWMECIRAYPVDDETAEGLYTMLTAQFLGRLYGQDAMDAYSGDPANMVFDCFFENGIVKVTINGNVISGVDADGNELFRHAYAYVNDVPVTYFGQEMPAVLHIYQTDDADAGMFTYFAFSDDTLAETQHIEFRYGETLENMGSYTEGLYAYWLAGAIQDGYSDKLIKACIKLFVDENVGEMFAEEAESTDTESVIETAAAESVFAGGNGTAEDPWQIATAEQLLALSASVNDGSAYGYPGQFFVLTADIDLKDVEWQPIGHMDLTDMSNYNCMFMGTLDGQGHTISNVTFHSDYPVCGVGVVGMSLGEVKNLTVQNVDIRCEDTYSMAIGGVIGYNMGVIHDVTLTGENHIVGVNAIGGIAGGSTQSIWNCTVDGTTIHVLGDNDFSSGRIIQEDVAECGGLVVGGFFGGTLDNCTAKGTVIAEGNEPVGLGGIAGCLEMMDSITNCTAEVEIISEHGGHAIGGLCGYSGTHSVGDIALATEGVQSSVYPGVIDNCHVTAKINIPSATHVGGLVGTGLYYYGEETAFKVSNCTVSAEIIGAVTPGAVAGRAVNSVIESCDAQVTLDGNALTNEIGETATMYESGDQLEADTGFTGGSGTKEDPWQIASAEQLNLIRENLAGHYILIADIDLSGYENWEPIGAFRSLSDAPEDAEVLHPDYAFTGTFDGAGHTISNLTVSAASPMGAGLFGCASGTENGEAYIGNFTLENINVSGFYLVGGAVGLQFMNCKVSDITLQGENKLSGAQGIGGIVGTGFDLISNCTATADITVIGDDGACAGIIAGGTTMSSIVNCEAVGGSVVAEGKATWGFGAICGAPWGAPQITGCKVSGTSITVSGEGNRLVGGLVGFGGTYDPSSPAQITGCTVENVTIIVSNTTTAVGGLIGGGKEMMEGSDVMSSFEIHDCSVSGSIVGGGEYTDAVVGDPACAVSVDCQRDMSITETVSDAA